MERKLIWSSDPDLKGWSYEDYEDWCECNGIEPEGDEGFNEWVRETNDGYLEDEKLNLDKEVGCVISICRMRLWDGEHITGHILGGNINDIFTDPERYRSIEDAEWFGEDGDIHGLLRHHDGTNHAIYRKCASAEDAGELLEGAESWDDVLKGSESIYRDVAEIYGWD